MVALLEKVHGTMIGLDCSYQYQKGKEKHHLFQHPHVSVRVILVGDHAPLRDVWRFDHAFTNEPLHTYSRRKLVPTADIRS